MHNVCLQFFQINSKIQVQVIAYIYNGALIYTVTLFKPEVIP
jgi:hypothetical protein